MNITRTSLTLASAVLIACACISGPSVRADPVPVPVDNSRQAAPDAVHGSAGGNASDAGNLGKFGRIVLTADSSTIAQSAIVYTNAHLIAQNGATLDADEIRANIVAGGKLENAVATGHVKAHIAQPMQKQAYTVTADKGVFEPKENRIDLTGDVHTTVDSPATTGPIVQTGDSGIIYLGKAPDFPKFVMTNVHAVFTPAQ